MKKQPYGLNVNLLPLDAYHYSVTIINFAHLQVSDHRALGFSINLRFTIDDHNDIHFNDDGNLLKVAVEAVKIIYNLQLKQTKVRKINVIPIYSGGLVRYMNNPHSMFSYLKPVNKRGTIVQHFKTHGYLHLKKAIAEYAVMALSIIHYAEIVIKNQARESDDHHEN
ncbi:MAG: hypothetical protein AJITA_00496 [Acetilactobacillus jinshanensis]